MDIDLIEKLPEVDAVDKIKLDGEDDEKLLEEAEQLYEHGQVVKLSDKVCLLSCQDVIQKLECLLENYSETKTILLPNCGINYSMFSRSTSRYVRRVAESCGVGGLEKLDENSILFAKCLIQHLVLSLNRLHEGKSTMPLLIRKLYYAIHHEFAHNDDVVVTMEKVTDYIDRLCCLLGCTRESLGVMACDTSSAYVGMIIVTREDIDSKGPVEENGSKLNQAYQINCFNIKSVRPIDDKPPLFILIVEKMTVFNELCSSQFHHRIPCVVITSGGQPSVECQQFVKMVHESLKVPIFAFVGCNAFGIEIFKSYKYGSGRLAFMSRNLVVPSIELIGLFYSDVVEHGMEDGMAPLKKIDYNKTVSLLEEPWIPLEPHISKSLKSILENKRKADVELLSYKKGCSHWVDDYLLEKLRFHLKEMKNKKCEVHTRKKIRNAKKHRKKKLSGRKRGRSGFLSVMRKMFRYVG